MIYVCVCVFIHGATYAICAMYVIYVYFHHDWINRYFTVVLFYGAVPCNCALWFVYALEYIRVFSPGSWYDGTSEWYYSNIDFELAIRRHVDSTNERCSQKKNAWPELSKWAPGRCWSFESNGLEFFDQRTSPFAIDSGGNFLLQFIYIQSPFIALTIRRINYVHIYIFCISQIHQRDTGGILNRGWLRGFLSVNPWEILMISNNGKNCMSL